MIVRHEQLDQVVAAMDQAAARFTHRPAMRDVEHTLTEIVTGAVAAVPGATHAGLTVRQRDGRLTSTAPTTELVARLDQAQSSLGEGPCVLAAGTDHDGDDVFADGQDDAPAPAHTLVVRVDDMPAEAVDGGRWPRFGPEAVRNDINSMMSIQLFGDQAQVTALNLYAQHPHTFDDAAETVARLFADQAAIALYGARHAAGLNDAVTSRDIIGQAKGILIERHRITGPDAFAMLVRTSQDTNIKLVEVAEWLVTDTSPDDGMSPALTRNGADATLTRAAITSTPTTPTPTDENVPEGTGRRTRKRENHREQPS